LKGYDFKMESSLQFQTGYIEKPIDPDTFVAKIEQHLQVKLRGE